MRLSEWLAMAQRRLEAAGVASAALEARLLAGHALNVDRAWILAHPEAEVPELAMEALLARREAREPLAYVLGWREFYGRRFAVRSGVLIPRQETELLVEAALSLRGLGAPLRILDMGTGSGCIAITLKLERPHWAVIASDISSRALAIAEENACSLGAEVQFVLADGLSSFGQSAFDIVVSNPPYIGENESLMPEVAQFEPREALYAGRDGLSFYRRLASEASRVLKPGGHIVLELGFGQASAVTSLFETAEWEGVEVRPDLADIERVLVAKRKGGRP